MTQLLVSVRDATEAAAALAGGADFIDVKEPARGALGFADAQILRDISALVGRSAVLSAALGDLGASMPDARTHLVDFSYAKLGLAGALKYPDWPVRWREAFATLPPTVRQVAVVYADWRTCSAPSPLEVLQRADELLPDCRALLIDTYAKQGQTSFDFMTTDELSSTIAAARDRGWLTLLAGALRREHLPLIHGIDPDVVAVRGAVCVGGRVGRLSTSLVAEFRRELAHCSHEGKGAASFDSQCEFA